MIYNALVVRNTLMIRSALAIGTVMLALGCGDDGSSTSTDAGSLDGGAIDGGPSDASPDAPAVMVTRTGGVIAIAERHAFCLALASCGELEYAECRDAVDDTATVQVAIAGCTSDAKLTAAVSCMKTGTCASCNGALTAWASSYASQACENDVYSVGIGDRYPIGASDSTCDGGVRADGGWCSRACSTAASCAGTGSNGMNHFGTQNTCAADSFLGGKGCYPTCTSTADCQAWFGETRFGLRIACKQFDDGSAPANTPICVRVNDDRGVELP